MAFFNSAVTVLQTLVIALGAGLGIWGAINLLEGYGNDNPDSYKLLRKELMAFINFLSNLPPVFGQMEISIFIHGQKTAIL